MKKMWIVLGVLVFAGIIVVVLTGKFSWFRGAVNQGRGKRTNEDVVVQYGPRTMRRLQPALAQAGFHGMLPEKLALLAFKQEQTVEVWGKRGREWRMIKRYSFTANSGGPGPKLKEGDGQIPEGIYHIEYMNPNSSYHLSFKVSYPNDFDRAMAEADGRTGLGGDIFFHGKSLTIGCIPVGDEAIEELFILVDKVGMDRVQIIIAPLDFRKYPERPAIAHITWAHLLYDTIEFALTPYSSYSSSDDSFS